LNASGARGRNAEITTRASPLPLIRGSLTTISAMRKSSFYSLPLAGNGNTKKPSTKPHFIMRPLHQKQSLISILIVGTVNHSENFVDPTTGTHTQTIECYWRHLKTNMRKGGIPYEDEADHIWTFLYMKMCRQNNIDVFEQLLQDIKA